MTIYQTRAFARVARKNGIGGEALREAIARAGRGLVDAEIGRFLIKQRVARPNEGRSGGFRTVVVRVRPGTWLFLFAFPKNVKADLTPVEEEDYRSAAKAVTGIDDAQIQVLVDSGKWIEVSDGES